MTIPDPPSGRVAAGAMDPLLIDVPEEIRTPRLVLRAPRVGDGSIILPAVLASLVELKPWMPWASDAYDVSEAEGWCRGSVAKFAVREAFSFLLFNLSAEHVGNATLFNFNWKVPRCEVGYWLATKHWGQGLMTEAVGALYRLACETLGAQRVEIRCDDGNERSAGVAVRGGFELEGILRRESRAPDGTLRDTRVYARLPAENT